jgi:hypothetical protein
MRLSALQLPQFPDIFGFFLPHLRQAHSPPSPLIWSCGIAPPPIPVGRLVEVLTPAMIP